jgi:predicted NBD/HSP70 family sugar kinase
MLGTTMAMESKNGLRAPSKMPLRKAAQTELSVLKLIQARPSISRIELAHETGLSTAAITGVVNSLSDRNLLVEGTVSSANVGRKRVGLRLTRSLGYVIGVDLGTFNLRIAVTDLNGEPLAQRQIATEMSRGRPGVLARCFAQIREVIAEAGLGAHEIRGIGVAFSGMIDLERGMILSYPRPGFMESWRNVPLREICELEFGVPCVLEDSVRAIAIMERFRGNGRNYQDFVYVDVGMGVGATIFIQGKVYRGCNGSAGEFGHITVDENGPLCCCGSYGCLEALASGARIIETVQTALAKGVSSRVLEMASGDPLQITIEMIALAATEGDSLSYRALSESAKHLGAATADLVNLLNPQAIIFGGAVFRAAPDFMLEQLSGMVRHRAMEKSVNDVTLRKAETLSDAGALGMAMITAGTIMDAVYCEGVPESAETSAQTVA